MKKLAICLVCIVLLLSVVATAFAQGMMDKKELEFAAAWAKISDLDATLLLANGGKFLNPNLELQATVLYAKIEDLNIWAIGPMAVYHFFPTTPSSSVPYVGAGFYYASASDGSDINHTDWQAVAGVKSFIGGDYTQSNRAWFAEFRYIHNIMDSDENISSIMVGIANYF